MKRAIQLACVAVLIATAGQAQASLMMNITDAGGGNSRFVFSGSAVVVSGANPGYNSIWTDPSVYSTNPLAGSAYSQPIIAGSGTVTSSVFGTFSVFDVYSMDGYGFAPRVPGSISTAVGATVSWSGDLISSHPFSNFNPGVYTTNIINQYDNAVLDSDYVLTIGPAVPVPEPFSLAI